MLCTECTHWPTIHVEQIRQWSFIVCWQLKHFNSFIDNWENRKSILRTKFEWITVKLLHYIILQGRKTETEWAKFNTKKTKESHTLTLSNLVRSFLDFSMMQQTWASWRSLKNNAEGFCFLVFCTIHTPLPAKILQSQPGLILP